LDSIRAYEIAVPAGPGESTTFWNVLPALELRQFRDAAQSQLESLRNNLRNLPPDQAPLALVARGQEVSGWVAALDSELDRRRTGNDQIRLKPIRGDLSADQARRDYALIERFDGSGRESNFQQKLDVQIEMRLHAAPQDATLLELRTAVPKPDAGVLTSESARGPPSTPAEAQVQLRSALLDEFRAVSRRDAVGAARVRARVSLLRRFIGVSSGTPAGDSFGYAALPSEDVLALRTGWSGWLFQLERESLARPGQTSIVEEQQEAGARLEELTRILEARHMPSASDTANPEFLASEASETSPELAALKASWGRELAYRELTELGLARNRFRPITSMELSEEYSRAAEEMSTAATDVLRNAWNDVRALGQEVLVNGRGPSAAARGFELLTARRSIMAAAAELRVEISDSTLVTSAPIRAKLQARLQDIPAPTSANPTSLSDALVALERARAASTPAGGNIEVRAVTGRAGGETQRIELGRPSSSVRLVEPPKSYDSLYPKSGTPKTLPEILRDPRQAPGGVVLSAGLPSDVADRITAVKIDVRTGEILVRFDGGWKVAFLPRDPTLAKIAWGFVSDGRPAAIDLRPLEPAEAAWLLAAFGDVRLSRSEQVERIQLLSSIMSVNLHDALARTEIAESFVAADQLMFDLIPASPERLEGEDSKFGLDLRGLRRAYRADAGAELNRPGWQNVLFQKSILAVERTDCTVGPELNITPRFSFHLFGVSARGDDPPLKLAATERWFAEHEAAIRAVPQLSRVAAFTAMTALFRAVRDRNIENNFEELIAVVTPEAQTARFLARMDRIGRENWVTLKNTLGRREAQ
jgi:hypothetical protein